MEFGSCSVLYLANTWRVFMIRNATLFNKLVNIRPVLYSSAEIVKFKKKYGQF